MARRASTGSVAAGRMPRNLLWMIWLALGTWLALAPAAHATHTQRVWSGSWSVPDPFAPPRAAQRPAGVPAGATLVARVGLPLTTPHTPTVVVPGTFEAGQKYYFVASGTGKLLPGDPRGEFNVDPAWCFDTPAFCNVTGGPSDRMPYALIGIHYFEGNYTRYIGWSSFGRGLPYNPQHVYTQAITMPPGTARLKLSYADSSPENNVGAFQLGIYRAGGFRFYGRSCNLAPNIPAPANIAVGYRQRCGWVMLVAENPTVLPNDQVMVIQAWTRNPVGGAWRWRGINTRCSSTPPVQCKVMSHPRLPGTYLYRARLRIAATGRVLGTSPILRVTLQA